MFNLGQEKLNKIPFNHEPRGFVSEIVAPCFVNGPYRSARINNSQNIG